MSIFLPAAFWLRVDKSGGPDACWPFTGPANRGGYGSLSVNGQSARAHRVAFSLHHERPVKSGHDVCHKCDNRICCNPSHLFEGTRKENLQDMVCKGRHASQTHPELRPHGADHWMVRNPELVLKGSQHGNAKLTEVDIPEIRRLRKAGVVARLIAPRFGVTTACIYDVFRERSWSHVC